MYDNWYSNLPTTKNFPPIEFEQLSFTLAASGIVASASCLSARTELTRRLWAASAVVVCFDRLTWSFIAFCCSTGSLDFQLIYKVGSLYSRTRTLSAPFSWGSAFFTVAWAVSPTCESVRCLLVSKTLSLRYEASVMTTTHPISNPNFLRL